MRNIKLTLEYDGTGFSGWQIQPQMRTVQGILKDNLEILLQEKVKILGAGRTDAGVHARGQVANFHTRSTMGLDDMHRALNALLPGDVVVHGLEERSPDFHARYSAVRRCYLYRIATDQTALLRLYVWTVLCPLNVSAMRRTAGRLLGTQDFTAFCLGSGEKQHRRCVVHDVFVRRTGAEIHFGIEANRFLHAMVRILVGRLVEVGSGRLSEEEFSTLLKKGERAHPRMIAPPQGLCLMDVKYE
jgi:tRNA pseudouridine38-40 synthase